MIKKQMQGGDPTYRTSAGQHLLAAAEASAITAMLTNPIWVAKTRIFATPSHDPRAYSGLLSESRAPSSPPLPPLPPHPLSSALPHSASYVVALIQS
jgi:hypothetical protein